MYDFDLEAAKKLLIYFLETRMKNPQIFSNRDVLSDEFQLAMKTFQCCALPQNTKENHKISVFRLVDSNPDNFSYVEIIRMILTLLDARLICVDPNELIDGEISIVDVSGFGFKHFTKVLANLGTMKAYFMYAQEAAPIKIIQSHFVNCPPIMGKMLAVMKPFMKKEVWDTLKIHSSLDSLYECLPKELLPVDYGGCAGSLDDLYKASKIGIEAKRDYLLCDDNWKIED